MKLNMVNSVILSGNGRLPLRRFGDPGSDQVVTVLSRNLDLGCLHVGRIAPHNSHRLRKDIVIAEFSKLMMSLDLASRGLGCFGYVVLGALYFR